ncbi:hypothetical protein AYO44_13565 [Planctomycetaceae bacterium SCGC AG-212-F19]|nr:hypothetical protein AYO44_13565 [Planctomycetaceae bacterium SCGC AG-212-F19]
MRRLLPGRLRQLGKRLLLRYRQPLIAWLCRHVPEDALRAAYDAEGYHLLRKHYYLPIPDQQDLSDPSLDRPTELVGVRIDAAAALDWLDRVVAPRMSEFRMRFPLHPNGDPKQFHLINGSFMAVDAHVYYALIRSTKPRQVIEIGGGQSSILAATALATNAREQHPGRLTVIDPFPPDVLRQGVPGLDVLIPQRLQEVDLDRFTALQAGDILFIDSTHVLRPGGDVQREYCEILPRLARGVLVHVHDICLPKPYPRVYFDQDWYWNEQYLLHAFLAFNSRFDVLWPGAYMTHHHGDRVRGVIPEIKDMQAAYPLADASSFWMRVRE